MESSQASTVIAVHPSPIPTRKPRPRLWNSWTGVAGVAISICIAAILVAGNVYGLKTWLFGSPARHPFRSLAVLPLENQYRVRITAQLVNGATDQHIWAENYDRELNNVLLLQSEVATDVAKQIDVRLTPQQQQRLQAAAHPVNPDAYQSYLLGRYYWDKRTANGLALSGKYFQDAIKKDPNFAIAYSGLSDYLRVPHSDRQPGNSSAPASHVPIEKRGH